MQKQYIESLEMLLSPLGFGVMRLEQNPDGTFPPGVHRLLAEAYERGINYFDTAYLYLGGRSEELIRDALVARYPRESFYIADKLPVWDCRNRDEMDRIFNVQLERLGVKHIDFYLLHGLHRSRWIDIHSKGVLGFLDDKRAEGKIRKAGFSFHDTTSELEPILDSYGWDFVQLQINYYDWIVQHEKDSYEMLAERGIPCFVMEPVGGGRLAQLPDATGRLLKDHRPDDSIASWAIRFSTSLPNVAVTLSGMSDTGQLLDNLSVFDSFVPLSEAEQSILQNVVLILRGYSLIPCTACRYCITDCPCNVDIPQIFKRYNDYRQFENMARFDADYYAFIPEQQRASNCVSCGECVRKCPQNIDIPTELKAIHDFAAGLTIGVEVRELKAQLGNDSYLVCFGAGPAGRAALSSLGECGFNVDCFCDNAKHLWGTAVDGIPVISPDKLRELAGKEKLSVLITSSYYDEIKAQLSSLGISFVEKTE